MKDSTFRPLIDRRQKRKRKFATNVGQKIVPRDPKSVFCRQMKNSTFRPKIDPRGQKSIFGQKTKGSNFQPKFA